MSHGRWALILLGLLVAGCAEELGPESWPTTRVSGTVREGRRPVGGGWIEFIPVEGTVGTLRVAPIRPDGTFQVAGVAVGKNTVGLVQAPVRGAYPWNFRSFQSSIEREIPPGPSTFLDLDLVDEAIRRQATERRPAAEPNPPAAPR